MNNNIQKLYDIARKPARLIIGLMSGTSLDGLDIALCKTSGSGTGTKMELLNFETTPYTDEIRKEIGSVFSKKEIDLEKLTLLNPWIALQHAGMINSCLNKWNIKSEDIDLVASHGQTIYHAPRRLHRRKEFGNATLQIGDGDHLAVATGIITLSDFRQKHIAAGGEGAPLAVYADQLLFSKKGEDRILLNIGGIANFTWLPGKEGAILCTDTGPGNTMMDAFIRLHYPGKYFDEDATLAGSGTVNEPLLAALKENDFFKQAFPKTTGPELFNLTYLENAKQKCTIFSLSAADTMATLNRFTADTIVTAIRTCVKNVSGIQVYLSGGGMHNPLLVRHIKEQLPGLDLFDTSAEGINPDAKEAVLFALLANEAVCGEISVFHNKKGILAVSMGKISFPC